MTKARTNASASPAVGRNMIINGAMNVAQRSASVTGLGAASGYFTVDRWQLTEGDATAGRLTMSQTADGPNGISANCLKLDCTTADTSIAAGEFLFIRQKIEGQNLQRIGKGVTGAKQITVSFYVKASAAFNFVVELNDNDNGRQMSKLYATTTDWVRHELTFPADVDDGSSPFDDDNAHSLFLAFWLYAGTDHTSGTLETAFANTTNANRAAGISSFFSSTDNNFFITGVQMEVGPVATEFEQEDIDTTLAKCQRYYQKIGGTDAYFMMVGNAADGNTAFIPTTLQTRMRAAPSFANNGTMSDYRYQSAGGDVTPNSFALDQSMEDCVAVNLSTANDALTAGHAVRLFNSNNAGYFEFKAEL